MNFFSSSFLAGFECSSHCRTDGKRLDLLSATGHDAHAERDYRLAKDLGLDSARDGLRWHLIEKAPGTRDWSTFLPMLAAADRVGMQIIWDLCHYGVPDHIDIWSKDFIPAFAAFAADAAEVVRDNSSMDPVYCPINEISFWAWAGGEVGRFHPVSVGRGEMLKRQLVQAYLAAVQAIRTLDPRAKFITAEPLINVIGGRDDVEDMKAAQAQHNSQYDAVDMLLGLKNPELGGFPSAVDVLGVNFYPDNQWFLGGSTIPLGHHAFRPLREMLAEVFKRYHRLMFISETGSEGTARPTWLHYVAAETRAARRMDIPVGAICLYPVLDYPGWENDRNCEVGLFCGTDHRICYAPLADQLKAELEKAL